MLRASRKVLRRGGRIAFTTIELVEGLSAAQRRRAVGVAPRAVAARRPYLHLLSAAGFVAIGMRDVSGDYLSTTRAWVTTTEPVRDLVAAVDGESAVDERLQDWRDTADLIELGWMKRTIYWGVRP